VCPWFCGIKKQGRALTYILLTVLMRRVQTKQTFKLRLLAFVLALALVWYSLNPAPCSIDQGRREDEVPDEKRLEAEPRLQGATISPVLLAMPGAGLGDKPVSNQGEEDFEWPEFIDG
jgi:hypothetical protein